MPKSLFKKHLKPIQIDDSMPDFSKDPVFVAKHEKAEKFIAEHGLPESFKTTPKAKSPKKAKGTTRKG